jgi:hypothetical protein
MHLSTCLALPATRWLDDPRERAVYRLIGWHTVDSVFRRVPSPLGCRPSAACRWGRTSAAPPEKTTERTHGTGELACASPALIIGQRA